MGTADLIEEKIKKVQEKRACMRLTIKCAIVIAICFLIVHFFVGCAIVKGNSMQPSLYDMDFVVYSRLVENVRRGDIIAIKMKNGDNYIKRVVGISGDTIQIDENNQGVNINGKKAKDGYAQGQTYPLRASQVVFPVNIKEDEIFVLGDNREHSKDSRTFGCVKKKDIIGIIKIRIGIGNKLESEK